MDRRTLIAVILIMAVLIGDQILMSQWNRHRQGQQPPASPTTTQSDGVSSGSSDPASPTGAPGGGGTITEPSPAQQGTPLPPGSLLRPSSGATVPNPAANTFATRPRVSWGPSIEKTLQNDNFRATLSSDGGTISEWVLPHYKNLAQAKAPVNLVPPGRRALRLVVTTPYFIYDFTDVSFQVAPAGFGDSSVTFVADDSSGIRVTKTYRLAASRPQALDVEIGITVPPEYGAIQFRWGWASALPTTEVIADPHQSQAVALLGDKLEAFDATRLQKEGTKTFKGNVRWAGDRTKYFVAALIPDSATVEDVQFESAESGSPIVWLAGAAPPGTQITRRARLYAGPIHYDTLVAQGATLDRLANLGWRWITGLSALLIGCLNFLYKLIPNYGIAIILISAGTKLVFYPLTQSSLRSMKLMHNLQPKVKVLQDRHKGDPAKLNQAMMALYKENKVNPMSGCLPMLLQIPVFFALYNVLLNSIELRGASFVGYVQDLSVPDVLFRVAGFAVSLFPIIMTGSTYLMQSQTPVAPQQKTMMMLMPAMMLIFMYNFPSGVILYWTVNNLLSALQQYLVNVAEDRKMALRA